MPVPRATLKSFSKKHDFLVAIDSDGCAFDTMEVKQKECFIPNIIRYWHLQPVSKFARAAAEFVSLYSKWRGINRWPALIMVFDLLHEWPDVRRRGVPIPVAQPLRDWIARETRLANSTLEVEVRKTGDPILAQGLAWSEAVNASVAGMVRGVPPFPLVRESLAMISEWADILVCSVASEEALGREWEEHGLAGYASLIAGQELGSKIEHIQLAANGRYDKSRILMIGDAPGDLNAARGNGARFFPVNPGREDASWELFFHEVAGLFLNGQYTAEREGRLIAEFDKLLPEVPPWKT